MAGRCAAKPELPEEVLPLEARIAVLPVAGGERSRAGSSSRSGTRSTAGSIPLDEQFP